jgi:predicted nucleotide-binding protein
VESFIHHIGLEPVVLHRQPDKGRTIIEKFEQHSDVGYAFILLTPDDVAYTRDQESLDDTLRKKEIRARQNVIFEFGYFVGKLGRNRVCCIYKEGVDIPSDLGGLTYKKVDDSVDPQAFSIIKELQAAGYKLRI